MKVKYFLRGLGIGILVTTLLLSAGTRKESANSLTDAEIMERASELGMLTEDEVSDYRLEESLDNLKEALTVTGEPVGTELAQAQESVGVSPNPSPEESEAPKTSPSPSPEKEQKTISIEIESGMVSKSIAKYLYQKNVVGSASDFNTYMLEHNVTQKLRAGTYEIPTDATYAEIVEIIT